MNDKHMKECFKPHTMLHSLFGFGLGIIAAAIFDLHGMTGFAIGLALMAVAFIGDLMMGMKKGKK